MRSEIPNSTTHKPHVIAGGFLGREDFSVCGGLYGFSSIGHHRGGRTKSHTTPTTARIGPPTPTSSASGTSQSSLEFGELPAPNPTASPKNEQRNPKAIRASTSQERAFDHGG
jgi:hypothetical protein